MMLKSDKPNNALTVQMLSFLGHPMAESKGLPIVGPAL